MSLLAYEGIVQVSETAERHYHFQKAREYCDKVGKPLLRIGVRRSIFEPPNGDVTLDIDPVVRGLLGGIWGDERKMPFRDKQFGYCFNEHTLEHLETPEDVALAVKECVRVADRAVFLAPSPYGLVATFFCPTHRLRLWFGQGKMFVVPNTWRTGLGLEAPAMTNEGVLLQGIGNPISKRSKGLGQVLEVEGVAPIVELG